MSVFSNPSLGLSSLAMRGLDSFRRPGANLLSAITQEPLPSQVSATAESTVPQAASSGSDLAQMLLAAGLVGGGAYGASRLLSRKKPKEDEMEATTKLSRDLHGEVAREVSNCLTKLASTLPLQDQQPIRHMQASLAAGASLRLATKIAFPHMNPTYRALLRQELLKQAFFTKTTKPQSGISKELDVKMFDDSVKKSDDSMSNKEVLGIGMMGTGGAIGGAGLGNLAGSHLASKNLRSRSFQDPAYLQAVARAEANAERTRAAINRAHSPRGAANGGRIRNANLNRDYATAGNVRRAVMDRMYNNRVRYGSGIGGLVGGLAGMGIPYLASQFLSKQSAAGDTAYMGDALMAGTLGVGGAGFGMAAGHGIGQNAGEIAYRRQVNDKYQNRMNNYNKQHWDWLNKRPAAPPAGADRNLQAARGRELFKQERARKTLAEGHAQAKRLYLNDNSGGNPKANARFNAMRSRFGGRGALVGGLAGLALPALGAGLWAYNR